MQGTQPSQLNEFITQQRVLLDMEQEEERSLIEKLFNEIPLNDLAALGYVLYNLRIQRIKRNRNDKRIVNLQYKEEQLPAHLKIGVGDQVGVYEWSQLQPSGVLAGHKSLASGVIEVTKGNKIKLVLDDKRSSLSNDQDPDCGRQYCIAIQDNTVTYRRQLPFDSIRNIKVLQKMKQSAGNHELLDYLFGPISRAQPSTTQIGDITAPSFKQLNELQRKAVLMCLDCKAVALIHGPPGTGKTRTLCEFLVHAVRIKRYRVLATAPSNVAVDNMIERIVQLDPSIAVCRLGHPARVLESVRSRCVSSLIRRTSSWNVFKEVKLEIQKLERKLERASGYAERKDLREQLRFKQREQTALNRQLAKEVVDDSAIVFCTNIGAGDKLLGNFDVVVIDECAQSLEVSCWIPILKGRRLVVAGDHKQLPPTIKSHKAEQEGLGQTLFERIVQQQLTSDTVLLTTQYRMNESIMTWSSQEVYGGQLVADETVKSHTIKDFGGDNAMILLFIDTAGCDMPEAEPVATSSLRDMQKSKSNEGEAALVKIIVNELCLLNVRQEDIGVITPYSAQVQLLRQLVQNVEVSTVDGFQGREKECIVISMVRSNRAKEVGFLSEFRRMNVAVTRAKRFVCIVGNSDTVSKDPFLKRMLQYFETNGEVRSAKQYNVELTMCQEKPEQKKTKKKQKPQQQQKQKLEQQQALQNPEVIDDEQRKQRFQQLIANFLIDSDQEFTVKGLNSFERMLLHDLAEQNGLSHVSIGNAAIKDIVISKVKEKQQQKQEQVQEIIEIETPVKLTDQPTRSQKESAQVQVQAGPIRQQHQNLFNQLRERNSSEEETVVEGPVVKEKQKKQKKAKKPKVQEKEKDPFDDLIEVTEVPLRDPKLCYLSTCTTLLNILKIECKFCQRMYCSRHTLAEEHGCGDAAKVKARHDFLNKGQPQMADLAAKASQQRQAMQAKRKKK